jgi:hypothetical protein
MSTNRFIRTLLAGGTLAIPEADPLHILRDPRLSRYTLKTRGNGGIVYVFVIPNN